MCLIFVKSLITVAITGMVAGCAQQTNQSPGNSVPSPPADVVSKPSVPKRPALALLAAQDVASRLEDPISEKTTKDDERDNTKIAQFAASLKEHVHHDAVVGVIRTKIRDFNSIPSRKKPMFILLGAEALSVADTRTYAQALVNALRSSETNVLISALATIARHTALAANGEVRAQLLSMLSSSNRQDAIKAHWLTVAARAVALDGKTSAIVATDQYELARAALMNTDLDAEMLLQGADHTMIAGILARDAKLFNASRVAQIRKILGGGI